MNYTSYCYRAIKVDSMGSIKHGIKAQSMVHGQTMRLMLNKVAADNITGLFPTDWQPRTNNLKCAGETLQSAERSKTIDRYVLTMWSLD